TVQQRPANANPEDGFSPTGHRIAPLNNDALTRMDAHRVEVFHVADRDAVIELVTDDLVFDFLPSDEVLFDQYLRAVRERLGDPLAELLVIGAKAGTEAAQRVCRPDH